MTAIPDREEIRAEIERYLSSREWLPARDALERLWRRYPSGALAPYISGGFERLSAHLQYHSCRVAILRSFTVEPVLPVATATAWVNRIELTMRAGGFNAYAQELLNRESWVYEFSPDAVVIAAQTQDLAPALWEDAADLADSELREVARRVIGDFETWIEAFRSRSAAYLLLHTLEVPRLLSRGILDAQSAFGQVEAVHEINLGLRRLAAAYPGVHVLDYDALVAAHGRSRWRDEHKWITARMPLRAECTLDLAEEWVRFFAPMSGRSCKVLACDLDNTLWGGVVGEDGIEGIRVDREYPGAAYWNLQRALLDLKRRGIVLAIASKNNPEDAAEAFRAHPGMLLRPEDFTAERINWGEKAQSLREIASELNVGLDSIAFLDDNPVERERVRAELPQVTVIDLPPEPMAFAETLRRHAVFERLSVSAEDTERSRYYSEQRSREMIRAGSASIEDYYRSLRQEVEIAPVTRATLARAAQLTQKTNQFNLTTRRYRDSELTRLMQTPGWDVYIVRVKDRFGDNGLVGLMAAYTLDTTCEIDTFLMSCRVISRTVETAMLAFLAGECRARGVQTLRGHFLPTAKNGPAADFYARHAFERGPETDRGVVWTLDLNRSAIECPEWIQLSVFRGTSLCDYAIP